MMISLENSVDRATGSDSLIIVRPKGETDIDNYLPKNIAINKTLYNFLSWSAKVLTIIVIIETFCHHQFVILFAPLR